MAVPSCFQLMRTVFVKVNMIFSMSERAVLCPGHWAVRHNLFSKTAPRWRARICKNLVELTHRCPVVLQLTVPIGSSSCHDPD